jgi:hypothetical protein
MRPASAHVPLVVAALAILGLPGVRTARAGPATYDRASRSFRMTYTFARVPSFGSTDGAVVEKEVTREQDANVRGWLAQASPALRFITDGRAKVSSLDYVDSIEGADILVSLTGQPAAPSWATLNGIEGRPGHCVVYYHSVAHLGQEDAVANIVHSLGHYIFGLADEYDYDKFPGGCPANAHGPGCLMDNFLTEGPRGGWSAAYAFCDESDHNSQPAQPRSCQAIVDEFFEKRGQSLDRATQAFRSARKETGAKVHAFARDQGRAQPAQPLDPKSLRDYAEKTLQELMKKEGIDRPKEEWGSIIGLIVHPFIPRPLTGHKGGIDFRLRNQLQEKARELAARYPEGTRYPPETRRKLIQKQLRVIAMGSSGGYLLPQWRQEIEEIVQEVMEGGKVPRAGVPPAANR